MWKRIIEHKTARKYKREKSWKSQPPYIHSFPRLLWLEAMVGGLKVASKFMWQICLGVPRYLRWNSATQSRAETSEASFQELFSKLSSFHLIKYCSCFWCYQLFNIFSTFHSSLLFTITVSWPQDLRVDQVKKSCIGLTQENLMEFQSTIYPTYIC